MKGLLFALALASWQVAPQRATVGDVLTAKVEPPARIVSIQPSPDYEVVKRSDHTITFRSFSPGTHRLIVTLQRNGVEEKSEIPFNVGSVLKKQEEQPSPLRPPRSLPGNDLAVVIVVVLALTAIASWVGLFLLQRRRPKAAPAPIPALPPLTEFRASLDELARLSDPLEAATRLADATRRYLHRTDVRLSEDLTTSELMRVSRVALERRWNDLVGRILTRGDQAKFSPWKGGENVSLDEVRAALESRSEAA